MKHYWTVQQYDLLLVFLSFGERLHDKHGHAALSTTLERCNAQPFSTIAHVIAPLVSATYSALDAERT